MKLNLKILAALISFGFFASNVSFAGDTKSAPVKALKGGGTVGNGMVDPSQIEDDEALCDENAESGDKKCTAEQKAELKKKKLNQKKIDAAAKTTQSEATKGVVKAPVPTPAVTTEIPAQTQKKSPEQSEKK